MVLSSQIYYYTKYELTPGEDKNFLGNNVKFCRIIGVTGSDVKKNKKNLKKISLGVAIWAKVYFNSSCRHKKNNFRGEVK